MNQRIVVLGASGYIGRQMLKALAGCGWAQPVAASRSGAAPDGIESIAVDACDQAALAGALAGADGVIDCVAGGAATIETAARTLYAVAATLPARPRIVQLSSMAVYGSISGPVDEFVTLQGDLGPYSAAKVAAEGCARGYPNAVTLRPGIVYGRGSPQWSARVARWLLAGRLGELGEAGEGICNLVHVDDVVAAALAALREPAAAGQAYNLAMPFAPTWNGYFAAYAAALGALPLRHIPRWRLKLEGLLLAPPLKIAEIVAGKAKLPAPPPPIPPSLLRGFGQRIRLESAKVSAQLGMRWTPLAEGLAEAASPWRRGSRG